MRDPGLPTAAWDVARDEHVVRQQGDAEDVVLLRDLDVVAPLPVLPRPDLRSGSEGKVPPSVSGLLHFPLELAGTMLARTAQLRRYATASGPLAGLADTSRSTVNAF